MEPADLCVPIYLNQKIVFDVLAVLEDGFTQLSTIRSSASETESAGSKIGGSVGASNVFAFLGISLGGTRDKQKGSQGQTEKAVEKVHAPTSLFSKLRFLLDERSLIERVAEIDEVEHLKSGQFVEFRAILRKNPLFDYIDVFSRLLEVANQFSEQQAQQQVHHQSSNRGGGSKKRKNAQARQPKTEEQSGESQVLQQQLEVMRTALTQSNTLEIIGEMLEAQGANAVLSTNLDYFNDKDASEIIDGEFLVLGKVVRVVESSSDESINLLRKTNFGRLSNAMFDELGEAFADTEEAGIELPEFVTEIAGPSIQIIPIAIFA